MNKDNKDFEEAFKKASQELLYNHEEYTEDPRRKRNGKDKRARRLKRDRKRNYDDC